MPKFSLGRPKELPRFIRQIEDLWKECGMESDSEKKESIGKYADQESEEEWGALQAFNEGYTWDELKRSYWIIIQKHLQLKEEHQLEFGRLLGGQQH